ncbi:MAG TPA: RagB/SusD family nutrient uptake outer membrane protein [Bacteroides sp.]|nr:RagB/SusD family nutrient uptake outer membrane protein [Bacteroides sp.]
MNLKDNVMKNLIVKYLILASLVISAGCGEDFLEVENKNALTDGSFYATQNDFLLALNSCYSALADRGMYGLQFHLNNGTWEDRVLFETTNRDYLAVMNAGSGENSQTWQAMYFGLYRTSQLVRKLNEVPEITGFTQETRTLYEAQARALRAMYYFYLVTFYHSPVYYDENSVPVNFEENYSNGDPIQFWDQLETDLEFAIPNLPGKSEYSPEDLGRVTTGGASALLGKAMLYKYYHYHVQNGTEGSDEAREDLETARDAFLDVMNGGEYALVEVLAPKTRKDYLMALLSNTSFVDLPSENNLYDSENNIESVWEVQYSDVLIQPGWLPGWQWSGSLNTQYFSPHSNSYKNHEVHPDWFYACDTVGVPGGFDRDPRAYASCYITGDTMHIDPDNAYYKQFNPFINTKRIASSRGLNYPDQPSVAFGMKKYYFPVYDVPGTASPNNDPTNRRVIRYADVLLMYAEVMFLLGDDGTGLAALNQVRARVDMPSAPALTREAIMHERDIELAFECHRWNDLVRWSFDPAWGINWEEILGEGIFIVGKHEYYPIPVSEINVNNGALKQNPGW